jgi:flavin-dependent dehydrogenase
VREFDVLILGAGMAGACLARQIRLEKPNLSVGLLEKKTDFDFGIGESTVEVFDDYAIRNLKLGPYLARHHIVKHGLRFWFDSPNKDLPIESLSEQGRSHYTSLNRGVQLDRSRFDRDMCRMNQEIGVEVFLGCRVDSEGVTLDAQTGHTVDTSQGRFKGRYLIDALGKDSPLSRQLNLVPSPNEERGATGSYWVRVEGLKSIDDFGDEQWRRRVHNTLRWSSTNHFMYDGYWFWLIPISDDISSLGVTFDHDRCPLKFKNAQDFQEFARTHRCLDQLLGSQSEFLDFGGLKYLLRGTRQFFSTDRWFLAGMAGFFVDPLFSSSSAAIATGNRLIVSMIEADLQGSQAVFENRVRHFNIGMRNLYLRQKNGFSNYSMLGSFDTFVNWQTLRYHSILNYSVPMQHADLVPLIQRVDSHTAGCECAEGRWSPFQELGQAGDRLTLEFEEFVRAKGKYYDRNEGCFHDKTERAETRRKTVFLDFGEVVERESLLDWKVFVRYYLFRMCEMERVPFYESRFEAGFEAHWSSGQTLGQLLDEMKKGAVAPGEGPAQEWGFKGADCQVVQPQLSPSHLA